MCDLKQICTQSAGLRPFGVSLLVGGVEEDGTIKLFVTEPYGLYFQHRAAVIGEGEAIVDPILQKKWKANLGVQDGIKLGLSALKEFLGGDFNFDRVDASYINSDKKRFVKLSNAELQGLVK